MRHASTTVPVDSSWIASVTYASDATMVIRFRNGAVYRHFTVPRTIFEELHLTEVPVRIARKKSTGDDQRNHGSSGNP